MAINDRQGAAVAGAYKGFIRNHKLAPFKERNDIAHGASLANEVDPLKLLDLKALVRNSILSFVNGGWTRKGDFKHWVNQSPSYCFSPVAL